MTSGPRFRYCDSFPRQWPVAEKARFECRDSVAVHVLQIRLNAKCLGRVTTEGF